MELENRYLLLNGHKYFLSDLQGKNYSIDKKSTFEVATLKFCSDWLSGKETFSLQTSGSTGRPKTIIITAKQMTISAQMTLKALHLKKNDKALVCLNTEYIAGMMMLVRGLIGGLQMIIKEPVSNPFLDLDKYVKLDFTAIVPLQLMQALEEKRSIEILKNIRNIIVGGAPINHFLENAVLDFNNNIYHTYGMTETLSHIALRKLTGGTKNEYYTTLKGIEIETDTRGCLKVRGPVTENQWLITNDVVRLVDANKFIWRGRIDQVINSGGIKFQIEDLEKKIHSTFQHLKIRRRFFIVGKPDENFGEAILLIIEGTTSENILRMLKQAFNDRLERYEIPKSIEFIHVFKETLTGKIQRKETLTNLDIQ